MPRTRGMTSKELNILRRLVINGRVTYTQIARELGMSPAGVLKKVKKLEEMGVIKDYTAIVDHAKLGKGYKYIILMKTEPGTHSDVARKIVEVAGENILEVHEITGPFDIVVKAIAGDQRELNDLLRKILGIPGVRETNTSLVLETVIERLSIVPEKVPGVTE